MNKKSREKRESPSAGAEMPSLCLFTWAEHQPLPLVHCLKLSTTGEFPAFNGLQLPVILLGIYLYASATANPSLHTIHSNVIRAGLDTDNCALQVQVMTHMDPERPCTHVTTSKVFVGVLSISFFRLFEAIPSLSSFRALVRSLIFRSAFQPHLRLPHFEQQANICFCQNIMSRLP